MYTSLCENGEAVESWLLCTPHWPLYTRQATSSIEVIRRVTNGVLKRGKKLSPISVLATCSAILGTLLQLAQSQLAKLVIQGTQSNLCSSHRGCTCHKPRSYSRNKNLLTKAQLPVLALGLQTLHRFTTTGTGSLGTLALGNRNNEFHLRAQETQKVQAAEATRGKTKENCRLLML